MQPHTAPESFTPHSTNSPGVGVATLGNIITVVKRVSKTALLGVRRVKTAAVPNLAVMAVGGAVPAPAVSSSESMLSPVAPLSVRHAPTGTHGSAAAGSAGPVTTDTTRPTIRQRTWAPCDPHSTGLISILSTKRSLLFPAVIHSECRQQRRSGGIRAAGRFFKVVR